MNPANLITLFTALTGKTLDDIFQEIDRDISAEFKRRKSKPRWLRSYRRYRRIYARHGKR